MGTKTKKTNPKNMQVKPETREGAAVGKPIAAGTGRRMTGKVVSDKMNKSVVVEINRLVAHPIYKKRIRKTTKIIAHNELGAKKGNVVEIGECRPISKRKSFVVTKVLS